MGLLRDSPMPMGRKSRYSLRLFQPTTHGDNDAEARGEWCHRRFAAGFAAGQSELGIHIARRTQWPRRSCWSVQAELGWAVTLQWISRRLWCSITTNTYNTPERGGHANQEVAGK